MLYDTEAKALFSYRADIKAKRNYIRINTKKQKANEKFASDIMDFLTITMMVVMFALTTLI